MVSEMKNTQGGIWGRSEAAEEKKSELAEVGLETIQRKHIEKKKCHLKKKKKQLSVSYRTAADSLTHMQRGLR